jgi:hypothetical protein
VMPTVMDGPRVARALMNMRPFVAAPRFRVLSNPATLYDQDLRGGWRLLINHSLIIMRPGKIIQGGFDIAELRKQGVQLEELDPPPPPEEEPAGDRTPAEEEEASA